MPVEKGPDRRDADHDVTLARQALGHLGQRDVFRALFDEPEDELCVRIEPGAAGLALPSRNSLAVVPVPFHPPDGSRDTDPEPLGRPPRRHPARRSLEHPRAQVGTVSLNHRCLRITGGHRSRLPAPGESHSSRSWPNRFLSAGVTRRNSRSGPNGGRGSCTRPWWCSTPRCGSRVLHRIRRPGRHRPG